MGTPGWTRRAAGLPGEIIFAIGTWACRRADKVAIVTARAKREPMAGQNIINNSFSRKELFYVILRDEGRASASLDGRVLDLIDLRRSGSTISTGYV
jgi:hypothetical protein